MSSLVPAAACVNRSPIAVPGERAGGGIVCGGRRCVTASPGVGGDQGPAARVLHSGICTRAALSTPRVQAPAACRRQKSPQTSETVRTRNTRGDKLAEGVLDLAPQESRSADDVLEETCAASAQPLQDSPRAGGERRVGLPLLLGDDVPKGQVLPLQEGDRRRADQRGAPAVTRGRPGRAPAGPTDSPPCARAGSPPPTRPPARRTPRAARERARAPPGLRAHRAAPGAAR